MKSQWPNAFIAIVLTLALAGCAAQDGYKEAFDPGQAIAGSSQSFYAPESQVWSGALATLAQQGFTVNQANQADGVINAQKLMQDPSDSGLSYTITATVTLTGQDVAPTKQRTQVSLAANEQTIRHQKYHTWWHLLWILPLFPTGTEYNTVVRAERTVTDPSFYSEFFGGLKAQLTQANTDKLTDQHSINPMAEYVDLAIGIR